MNYFALLPTLVVYMFTNSSKFQLYATPQYVARDSLVVEHQSCKLEVLGSTPS